MKYTVTVDGDVFEIELGPGGHAWVNQEPYEVDLEHVGANGAAAPAGEYSLLMDNQSYDLHITESDNGGNDSAGNDSGHRWVTVGGRVYRTELQRGHAVPGNGRSAAHGGGCGPGQSRAVCLEMRAPLPGLLVETRVEEGESVEEQQVVAVLESMKMNLEVRAPRDGVVREVRGEPGGQVAQDEVLAVLGPAPE